MKHKIVKLVLVSSTLCPFVSFAVTSCDDGTKDIAILFTNDTHCTLENKNTGLGWAQLKGYRDWLETKNCDTLLVDAGDFAQGGVYGILSKGQYMTSIMNACEYDLTIPGNHEFDYGMARFNEIVSELKCPMISSNFYHYDYETSQPTTPVLNQTAILEAGGKKIGFVGATTPHTMVSSNPKNFHDEEGNQIYDFLASTTPDDFYSNIQSSIDSLKEQNVDYIIGLTHLGIGDDGEYIDYGSKKMIANTTGFDIVIDGHSHTYQPSIKIKDKEQNDVYLTQTGTAFQSFGQIMIHDNKFTFSLIDDTNEVSSEVKNVVDNIKNESEGILSKQIGQIPFELTINKDGQRIVRQQECNMGDFCADALAYAVGEPENDIVIYNSGGIRSNLGPNMTTYGDFLKLSPFGNIIGKISISGQTLLDALEYSVSLLSPDGTGDFGGFLQLNKNLKIEVNTKIPTPVVFDEKGGFDHIEGGKDRRITSAKYKKEDIKPDNKYTVISLGYTALDCGDGYNMFKDAERLDCEVILDVDCEIKYFQHIIEQETLLEKYRNPDGQGRIVIK